MAKQTTVGTSEKAGPSFEPTFSSRSCVLSPPPKAQTLKDLKT